MCNCISEIEKKALYKLKEDKAQFGNVTEAAFKHKAFSFKSGNDVIYNDIEYIMTNKKKDGSTGATKKYTISMYHSYCPFCGEELN